MHYMYMLFLCYDNILNSFSSLIHVTCREKYLSSLHVVRMFKVFNPLISIFSRCGKLNQCWPHAQSMSHKLLPANSQGAFNGSQSKIRRTFTIGALHCWAQCWNLHIRDSNPHVLKCFNLISGEIGDFGVKL